MGGGVIQNKGNVGELVGILELEKAMFRNRIRLSVSVYGKDLLKLRLAEKGL